MLGNRLSAIGIILGVVLIAWMMSRWVAFYPARSQAGEPKPPKTSETARMRLSLPLWLPESTSFKVRGGWVAVDTTQSPTVYVQIEPTGSPSVTIEQVTSVDRFYASPADENLLRQLEAGRRRWFLEEGSHGNTRGFMRLGRTCVLLMSTDGAKGREAIVRLCNLYERRYAQLRRFVQRDAVAAQKKNPRIPLRQQDWFAAAGGMFVDVYEH